MHAPAAQPAGVLFRANRACQSVASVYPQRNGKCPTECNSRARPAVNAGNGYDRDAWIIDYMREHGNRGRHVDLDVYGRRLNPPRNWRAAKYRLLRANKIRNVSRGIFELVL